MENSLVLQIYDYTFIVFSFLLIITAVYNNDKRNDE